MTADRHAAYCRAKRLLDQLAASKLLPPEQELLYDAADDLLLTNDPSVAQGVLMNVEGLLLSLVECGRWTRTMADPLLGALAEAGSTPVAA